jgi:hypothetical protein
VGEQRLSPPPDDRPGGARGLIGRKSRRPRPTPPAARRGRGRGSASAARRGSHAFEQQHLPEHLRLAVSGLSAAGATGITIALTRLDEAADPILAAVSDEFAGLPAVRVRDAPERSSGRACYRCLCFKVFATFASASEPVEIADGGFTDWTARLLGNAKERLLISGHGLDRVAILSSA